LPGFANGNLDVLIKMAFIVEALKAGREREVHALGDCLEPGEFLEPVWRVRGRAEVVAGSLRGGFGDGCGGSKPGGTGPP